MGFGICHWTDCCKTNSYAMDTSTKMDTIIFFMLKRIDIFRNSSDYRCCFFSCGWLTYMPCLYSIVTEFRNSYQCQMPPYIYDLCTCYISKRCKVCLRTFTRVLAACCHNSNGWGTCIYVSTSMWYVCAWQSLCLHDVYMMST